MKKLFSVSLIAILTLFTYQSYAQLVFDLNDFYQAVGGINVHLSPQEKKVTISGSPFAQTEFIPGTVIKNNGDIYKNIPLRYNKYEDRMEFKHKSGLPFYIDNPDHYRNIKIGDQHYIYGQFFENNRIKRGYFQLLEIGKLSLLKKLKCGIKESESAKPFQAPKPARYYAKPDEFYILTNEKRIEEVKNVKSIPIILNDHQSELSAYIKKEKIKTKKEKNLRQIISYYNTL